MRVSAGSVHRVGGCFAGSLHNARSRWNARHGWLVALETREGYLGLGESSPLPGYSVEEGAEVEAVLRAFVEKMSTPQEFDQIEREVMALRSRAARFALETALLDLQGQSLGCPLHQLQRSSAVGPVERSGLLQAATVEELIEEAQRKVRLGLRCLKVKIGAVPVAEELRRLRALRGALGNDVALRLDANGSYACSAWEELQAGLGGLGVELVEEPVKASEMLALGHGSVPWAADESLGQHAEAMVGNPACAAVVLKPAVLGWMGALRLGEKAKARGKKVIVTHLFDGPVALASACELALALSGPGLLPCGLDVHEGLGAYPSWEIPQLRVPGRVVPSARSGLGLGEVWR